MSEVVLDIIRVSQKIGEFYIAKMNAIELYKMAKADLTKINDEGKDLSLLYQGSQRSLTEAKVKSIENYLESYDATFPNSIILNVSKDDVSIRESRMIIKKRQNVFKIVDGQHRLAGFRSYQGEAFEVVVTIFIDLSDEEQARVFSTINSEQTKVDPSLSLYLSTTEDYYTPRKMVVELAAIFNTDFKSPWYRKIKIIGKKDDLSYDGIISMSAFAVPIIEYIYNDDDYNKIRNILFDKNDFINTMKKLNYKFEKYILWDFYAQHNERALYKILLNYFNAFKSTFKYEWGNRESIITKTTGYNAMMMLFKVIFIEGYRLDDLTEGFFMERIKRLEPFVGRMNTKVYGASGRVESNRLANDFHKSIYGYDI